MHTYNEVHNPITQFVCNNIIYKDTRNLNKLDSVKYFNNYYIKNLYLVSLKNTINYIPAFLRGGSIIPIRRNIKRTSTLNKSDPIQLIVFLDSKLTSEGYLYIDDLETIDYFTSKTFNYIKYKFSANIEYLKDVNVYKVNFEIFSENIFCNFKSNVFINSITVVGLDPCFLYSLDNSNNIKSYILDFKLNDIYLNIDNKNTIINNKIEFSKDENGFIIRNLQMNITSNFRITN